MTVSNMFNSVQELQDFLAWCRNNGVVSVEVGDIKATIIPTQPKEEVAEEDAFLIPPANGGW